MAWSWILTLWLPVVAAPTEARHPVEVVNRCRNDLEVTVRSEDTLVATWAVGAGQSRRIHVPTDHRLRVELGRGSVEYATTDPRPRRWVIEADCRSVHAEALE